MRGVFLFLIISFIAGCSLNTGLTFDPQDAEELTPEVSSIIDAAQILGQPMKEDPMPEGASLYTWKHAEGTSGAKSSEHVSILFDPQGIMIKVYSISDSAR